MYLEQWMLKLNDYIEVLQKDVEEKKQQLEQN